MDLNKLFGDMAGMGMPTDDEDPQYTKLNPDMLKGLGDDENMNEAIKRFNKLI